MQYSKQLEALDIARVIFEVVILFWRLSLIFEVHFEGHLHFHKYEDGLEYEDTFKYKDNLKYEDDLHRQEKFQLKLERSQTKTIHVQKSLFSSP